MIYQSVAQRRAEWDNLVWQVPVLSLTAQAFLVSIELGADTSRLARMLAAGLSIVIVVLSVALMTRFRQAEIADADWLQRYEHSFDPEFHVHGRPWQAVVDTVDPRVGPIVRRLAPLWKAYRTWVLGLWIFGLAALIVAALALFAPELLSQS